MLQDRIGAEAAVAARCPGLGGLEGGGGRVDEQQAVADGGALGVGGAGVAPAGAVGVGVGVGAAPAVGAGHLGPAGGLVEGLDNASAPARDRSRRASGD